MAYETLQLERHDAVLIITVNQPKIRNAQSRRMHEEFDQPLSEAAEEETVKVVIVARAGKHISAGHDIGIPQKREDQHCRPYAPVLPGEYKRDRDLYLD